jgi:hypothetical protein
MATNKWLLISESHSDSNRCTPCRENLINTPHIFHSRSMYGPWPYISHVVHVSQPFTSHQYGWTDALLPRKSVPNSTSQPGWVARGTCLSFCSNATTEAVRLIQAPINDKLLDLLSPYHQHVISTFNTFSQGPTHRSLTDIGGDYNLGGAGLPHYTPRPSQLMVLRFPPKGLALSQVINPIPNELEMEQTVNLASGSLHPTSTVSYLLSIAWANDEPLR